LLTIPSLAEAVAPTVVGTAGRAGTGAVPTLRPEEPLSLGFSELLDPSTLVPGNFVLAGPTGTTVSLIPGVGLSAEDIRVFADTPLQPGAYTLTISGVRDIASNGVTLQENTIAPNTVVSFNVAQRTAVAPSLLGSSPVNNETGHGQPHIMLTFNDTMSKISFVDTGPTRAFRLEDQIGGTFIPLKGLNAVFSRGIHGEIVELAPEQLGSPLYAAGRTYRVTVLNAVNLDETPVTPPAPIVFSTAAPGSTNHRPSWLYPGFNFMQAAGLFQSSFDAQLSWDDVDLGDQWSTTFSRVAPPAAGASTPLSMMRQADIGLSPAQVGPAAPPGTAGVFFVEGFDNAFDSTVTDLAANQLSLPLVLYSASSSTLLAARPTVTPVAAGLFQFQGTVADTTDASRFRAAAIGVLQLNAMNAPVEFAYLALAQITRNTDGTLSYSHTKAADEALPQHASGSYIAITALFMPPTIASGDEPIAISQTSAAFNPP
jgi:hypothetical protein